MESFLIKHVPISVENNYDDNQILISTSNHFYSFLGGPLFNYHPVLISTPFLTEVSFNTHILALPHLLT